MLLTLEIKMSKYDLYVKNGFKSFFFFNAADNKRSLARLHKHWQYACIAVYLLNR